MIHDRASCAALCAELWPAVAKPDRRAQLATLLDSIEHAVPEVGWEAIDARLRRSLLEHDGSGFPVKAINADIEELVFSSKQRAAGGATTNGHAQVEQRTPFPWRARGMSCKVFMDTVPDALALIERDLDSSFAYALDQLHRAGKLCDDDFRLGIRVCEVKHG